MGHLLELSVCLMIIFLSTNIKASEDFLSKCPSICSCRWLSGNKAAICSDKNLDTLPNNLSEDVQTLDIANNPLYEITEEAFQSIGLSNLKKLKLRNCKLQNIHRKGFSSLSIMIELDLSKNALKHLHPDTFSELQKLRTLNLNENLLEKLDDGLFKNLTFLQKIELNNNRIFRISPRAFDTLPSLKILTLSQNKLTFFKLEIISELRLNSLELHGNPWKCDCNLQSFRDYVIEKKLYTPPTSCAEPPLLANRLWNELNSSDFACQPNILEPQPDTKQIIQAVGDNVTLACKVAGNPIPDVNWVQNNRIIHNDVKKHGEHKYHISQSETELTKWVNLTIRNIKYHDRGDFICVAKNPGGVKERSLTLVINRAPGINSGGTSPSDSILYIILISAAGLIIILILFFIMCWCCKRKNIKRHSKADMHSSNGEALIEGSVIGEIEKNLMTDVNPVTKPPRRYDAPASVISGGTEMSELNKTLLDNESVFAPNEDDSRCVEYAEQHPKSSRDKLSVSTSNTDQRPYPPDLLSFPPRGGQASPAASSASTAPDSSRLPPQLQQSPLQSPIYGTNPNIFKTLSHSRSQSPFTSPCAPTALPRMGYVTIPRRPRIPSWGSSVSYVTTTAPAEYTEPVYDNLGLRTTVDGSSVLSLNKAGLEQQLSPVMRGRPLPSTPGSVIYTPIEEHDQAPSPAPSTPYSATLPRIGSHSLHFQISPTGNEKKSSRLKTPSKHGDQIYDIPKFPQNDTLSNGQIYDTPSANDALSRTSKIPPRPPPKPKKKNSTDSNGPLFEDEGEDGTEV